jgi:hypothetical protein
MTEEQIKAANQKFDRQFPHFRNLKSRLPSSWKAHKLIMGKPITDQQIQKYKTQGYFSDVMKDARAAYQSRKRKFLW